MNRWAMEDTKLEVGDYTREMFGLKPRARSKHATDHAIVFGKDGGGWEKDRMVVHRKREDVKGEEDSAFSKRQSKAHANLNSFGHAHKSFGGLLCFDRGNIKIVNLGGLVIRGFYGGQNMSKWGMEEEPQHGSRWSYYLTTERGGVKIGKFIGREPMIGTQKSFTFAVTRGCMEKGECIRVQGAG